MATNNLSIDQLKRALAISEQIQELQGELASIFGGANKAPAPAAKAPAAAAKPAAKKGGLTPEGRAKIVAALKARWAARKKGAAPAAKPAAPAKAKAAPAKGTANAPAKRVISPEARARMIAGAKRRWANKK